MARLALAALVALTLVAGTANAAKPTPKPLALSAATKAACDRVPIRLKARYKVVFERITPELADFMRKKYATKFACGFMPTPRPDGSIPYYLVSVKRGAKPCTFAVTGRLLWVNGAQPGYAVPANESYAATCKALRG